MLFAFLLQLAQTAPNGLAGHALVYSARDRAVLLVGGDAAGERPLYRLSGAAWVPVPGSELAARTLPAVAADDQGNLLMHGGAVLERRPDGSTSYQVTGDTWGWDGKAWTRRATSGPAPRDHHGMVFDSARRVFVLFGGSDAHPDGRTVLYGDTWEWTKAGWELVHEQGPKPGAHLAMAFDPVRARTILVGGRGDDRTWAWDGRTWEAVASGPPAERWSPRLTWDSVGARVLLFGGESGGASPADTWAFDGKTWSLLAPNGPPGRSVHALAFDAERGRAVLFGGAGPTGVLGDLWELSKDGWVPLGR